MSVAGFDRGIKDIHTLQSALDIIDYQTFYDRIKQLEAEGKIIATKNGRDTNGKYPPLAKKYRIIEAKEDVSLYINDINRFFPLRFDKSYYKKHLEHYIKDKEMIDLLIGYERHKEKPLATEMSVNERMFDIFTHEKDFGLGKVVKVLENVGLSQEWLNIYETPEPFIYFSGDDHLKQSILIVENKDTWHTMRRLIRSGIGPFNSVIYGEGKKILKSCEEFGIHQKPWFNNRENGLFYLGDLDDEGLHIYRSLKERVTIRGYKIQLWEAGYGQMYTLGEQKNRWRTYKPQKTIVRKVLGEILFFMDPEDVDIIWRRFNQNTYIPQEILNYSVLKRLLSEEESCTNS